MCQLFLKNLIIYININIYNTPPLAVISQIVPGPCGEVTCVAVLLFAESTLPGHGPSSRWDPLLGMLPPIRIAGGKVLWDPGDRQVNKSSYHVLVLEPP